MCCLDVRIRVFSAPGKRHYVIKVHLFEYNRLVAQVTVSVVSPMDFLAINSFDDLGSSALGSRPKSYRFSRFRVFSSPLFYLVATPLCESWVLLCLDVDRYLCCFFFFSVLHIVSLSIGFVSLRIFLSPLPRLLTCSVFVFLIVLPPMNLVTILTPRRQTISRRSLFAKSRGRFLLSTFFAGLASHVTSIELTIRGLFDFPSP